MKLAVSFSNLVSHDCQRFHCHVWMTINLTHEGSFNIVVAWQKFKLDKFIRFRPRNSSIIVKDSSAMQTWMSVWCKVSFNIVCLTAVSHTLNLFSHGRMSWPVRLGSLTVSRPSAHWLGAKLVDTMNGRCHSFLNGCHDANAPGHGSRRGDLAGWKARFKTQ